MKLSKRLIAAVCAGAVAVATVSGVGVHMYRNRIVKIDPAKTYAINGGKFEGWGTSLCWWANRLGYSDTLSQKAVDLFYGENGLRMNIARFNIGGGDDPTHEHIVRTDSNMPGYTVYQDGKVRYDWSADAYQRGVLQRAIKATNNELLVEMFSNSPPYYMTESGCTGGSANGRDNNLRQDQYDDFARYFAEVCAHYKNEWGVNIQSAEAMNEPQLWCWQQYSPKQEGCHFRPGKAQSEMILQLQKAMREKGLGDVLLCGTDETSIDTQAFSYMLLSQEAKQALGRIDTHSYSGIIQPWLKQTAVGSGKNLWMSESDSGKTAGKNAGEMGAALWLAKRIESDMNGLNPSAWIIWQAIASYYSSTEYNGRKDGDIRDLDLNGGYWGVAFSNHDNDTIILTKKYYAFGQYTRFIRPGMRMLQASGQTVAAYDEKENKVVMVVYNTDAKEKKVSFDLSAFTTVGTSAKGVRTDNSANWKDIGSTRINEKTLEVTLPGHSVTTYVAEGCEA